MEATNVEVLNTDWKGYDVNMLKELVRTFDGDLMKLVFAHISKKITQKKMDIFDMQELPETERQFHRGYVMGMEYLKDLKMQVSEELEARAEADLQKEKKQV